MQNLEPRHARLLMYGMLLVCLAMLMYLFGVLMVLPRLFIRSQNLLAINEWVVWYSGVPLFLGVSLALADLFLLLSHKRLPRSEVRRDHIANPRLVVVLTAYNDEDSIREAVADFRAHPLVDEVIVVSNNSSDHTMAWAEAAGATAVNEPRPGYGRCVYRCFQEALARPNELIVLCEGDRTFRGYDLDKFVAYASHADIVNGTRTVEVLRARTTQLSTFMYYGNLFVGKILEAKHVGRSTITDVGTTYKLCRRDALAELMPYLNPSVNLEFNAHFLDTALERGLDIVECPVTFHPRIGISKGGNVNNARALKVGLRMLYGIAWRWKRLPPVPADADAALAAKGVAA
jgi:hypothetical protein